MCRRKADLAAEHAEEADGQWHPLAPGHSDVVVDPEVENKAAMSQSGGAAAEMQDAIRGLPP